MIQVIGTVGEALETGNVDHDVKNFSGRMLLVNKKGRVIAAMMYNNNKAHGYSTVFHDNGRNFRKMLFKNGELVKTWAYMESQIWLEVK